MRKSETRNSSQNLPKPRTLGTIASVQQKKTLGFTSHGAKERRGTSVAVSRQKIEVVQEPSEECSDISFTSAIVEADKGGRRKTIKNDVSTPAVLIRKNLINNVTKQASQPFPGTILKRKTTMQKMQESFEYEQNVIGKTSFFS